jgi:hypothetical protein
MNKSADALKNLAALFEKLEAGAFFGHVLPPGYGNRIFRGVIGREVGIARGKAAPAVSY